MTEKLLTGKLSLNTNKQTVLSDFALHMQTAKTEKTGDSQDDQSSLGIQVILFVLSCSGSIKFLCIYLFLNR